MNYGKRLQELRRSRSLKQSDLAEIFDLSAPAIGGYERCERQPSFETLHKYAAFFNVSMDYILCNSDEKLTADVYKPSDTLDLRATLLHNAVSLDGVTLSDRDKIRIINVTKALLLDK